VKQISLKIGREVRQFDVIREPFPHILVSSKKELHGWWKGKRECTGERMLINPYNGCSVGCIFCYARALPAPYFRLFNETGIVTVFEDFDKTVAGQLDSLRVASCGYLSPVCDPFQAVESTYHLSEKIVREFVSRNIPVEFVTKCVVPQSVIDLMKKQAHSFGQFSLSTPDESVRARLMERGARVDEIFSTMTACAVTGLPVVLRIDPVIPYLTDSKNDLTQLVDKGIDSGARHIVASVMDIPVKIAKEVFAKFSMMGVGFGHDLKRIYTEQIDGYLHADIGYRKRVFDALRNHCDKRGITFALCMEYEVVGGRPVGLNREFMSSQNCEGADIPIYSKRAGSFVPAAPCNGACLNCTEALCGIDDLAMGRGVDKKDFTLRDYRRWSREVMGTRSS
jgi:DNA repair photolyase